MSCRLRFTGIVISAVMTLSYGCASGRFASSREAVVGPRVWPAPPQAPRIRFEQAISRPEDVGIRATAWQRVVQRIAGKGPEELFVRPTGVAVRDRIVYVADPGSQALWVLDAQAGRCQRIQTLAGQRLVSPVAVTPGKDGAIYLADSYLATVFALDARGAVTATITSQAMRRPAGVAYDAARDRLYVADSAVHCIWIFDGDGHAVGVIGHRGTGEGEFNFPTHLAVDRAGTLYVTDALGFRLEMFTAEGRFAGQLGRHGDSSGNFASPKGVAVDSEGHVYVVDALFDAVQIFNRAGQLLLSFGSPGAGSGEFWLPNGLFIDGRDRIYVADAYNRRIQIFSYLREGSR